MTFSGVLKKAPRYLYKYRAINERTRSIFTDNELYFSAPSGFNDPFDSKVIFLINGTEEDKQQYVKKVIQNNFPDPLPRNKEELLKRVENTTLTKSNFYSAVEGLGIFSLSEDKFNLLMWSHYADSHKGICLGFDVYPDDFFKRAMPVVYETEYPLINLYTSSDDDKLKLILTKYSDWRYEKEWRIIEPNGKGAYIFPPICLKEIILGCKISEENRIKIIKLIGSKFCVKVYQAKMKDKEFGIDIVELSF